MGNTFSTCPNTLLFASPHTHSHARRAAFATHYPSLIFPRFRSLPAPLSAPPNPSSLPTQLPLKPILKCYKVLSPASLLAPLYTLTTTLHATGPLLLHRGYIPVTLFLLTGDFVNPLSNAVLSILVEKVTVNIDRESGEEEVTGRHGWLHVYEPEFASAGFEAWLRGVQKNGVVGEVGVEVDEGTLRELEGVALFWPRAVWEGVVRVGMEGEEVGKYAMQGLEDYLWRIWLRADAGGE